MDVRSLLLQDLSDEVEVVGRELLLVQGHRGAAGGHPEKKNGAGRIGGKH